MSTPESASYEYQILSRPQSELLRAQVTALGNLALSPAMHAAGLSLPNAHIHELRQKGMPRRNIVIWPSPYEENRVCTYIGDPSISGDRPAFFLTTELPNGYDVAGVTLGYSYDAMQSGMYISTHVKNTSSHGFPVAEAADCFSKAATQAAQAVAQQPRDKMQITGVSTQNMVSMVLHINSFGLGLADMHSEAPFRHDLNPTYRMANAVLGHLLQRAGDGRQYDPPISEFNVTATPARVTSRGVIIPDQTGYVSVHQPSLRNPTIVLTDVPMPVDSYGPVLVTQHRIQSNGTSVDVHTFQPNDCNATRIPQILPYLDRQAAQQQLEISSETGLKAAHDILARLLQRYGMNAPV